MRVQVGEHSPHADKRLRRNRKATDVCTDNHRAIEAFSSLKSGNLTVPRGYKRDWALRLAVVVLTDGA